MDSSQVIRLPLHVLSRAEMCSCKYIHTYLYKLLFYIINTNNEHVILSAFTCKLSSSNDTMFNAHDKELCAIQLNIHITPVQLGGPYNSLRDAFGFTGFDVLRRCFKMPSTLVSRCKYLHEPLTHSLTQHTVC